jgi:hypothetical protein
MKHYLASIALAIAGLIGVAYSLELVGCIAAAQASVVTVLPAAPPEPSTDWRLTLLAIGTAISLALHGLHPFLRWLAPRTKTTLDDRLLELDLRWAARIDQLLALLPGAAAALGGTTVNVTTQPPASGPGPASGTIGLLAVLLVGAGLVLQPGCATVERGEQAAKVAALECGKPQLATAAALVARWAVEDALAGKVQWDKHETDALGFGLGVGTCAYAEVVRAWKAKPTVQALAIVAAPDESALAQAGLERLRAKVGGAPIKLADGTVL